MSSSTSVDSKKEVQQIPINNQCGSSVTTPEEYNLKTAEHSTYAFINMYEMKQRGQLCDVTLNVGSETFKAHRLVLASVSPYFFAMFNGEMKEQASSEIVLRDIEAAEMELLLQYAYTGEITIRVNNVKVLLSASILLEMQEVREACCGFLIKQLHLTNCLGIRRFADTISCKELLKTSHCYVMANFQQVTGTKEFLLLPFNEVEELVSNKQLNTSSEEIIFNAVLNWIKHHLINRRQYLLKLMVHVRLPLVDSDFLLTIIDKEPLMHEDVQFKKLIIAAIRCHLDALKAGPTSGTVKDKPKETKPYLFAIGGNFSLEETVSECEIYNPRSDSWSTIAPMLSKRESLGVTGLHRLLYAVGGIQAGYSAVATAECYNPLLNTWNPIPPMGTARYNLGISSFDGFIYACGGYDNKHSGLSTMEKFDPSTGVWYSCPAMSTIQGFCRIAVVESCIYAVGGLDYESDLIERFDPRTGNWSPVPSMSPTRGGCAVAAIDGHLYCVGGYGRGTDLSSGERLDIRKNVWEPISAMHNCRAVEAVAMDGCIYAVGYHVDDASDDEVPSLNSFEKYNPKINTWSAVSSMVTSRSLVRTGVLECLDIEDTLKTTKR